MNDDRVYTIVERDGGDHAEALDRVAARAAARDRRAAEVVPATRVSDGGRAWVRVGRLRLLDDGARDALVEARGVNPLVTVGAVVTVVGAALAAIGGYLVATSHGNQFIDVTAIFAAPIIVSGALHLAIGVPLLATGAARSPLEAAPPAHTLSLALRF